MVSKNRQIVIIDSDAELIRILTFRLQAYEYEVKALHTGEKALHYILEEKNLQSVSLIILSRLLPDMEGLEILRAFTNKFKDKIPVLILSALSSEQDILAGLRLGAIDYITKPFSLNILLEKIQILIKRSNSR